MLENIFREEQISIHVHFFTIIYENVFTISLKLPEEKMSETLALAATKIIFTLEIGKAVDYTNIFFCNKNKQCFTLIIHATKILTTSLNKNNDDQK